MKDGTFEQKLDATLDCLYLAYLESLEDREEIINGIKTITPANPRTAFVYNNDIIIHLTKIFTDKNLHINSLIERLTRDEKIWMLLEGGAKTYKLLPQGVDFITSGDSYVKISDREKIKRDLELLLLNSQIKANELSRITNVFIAVFTFIAAIYYGFEFCKDYFSECYPYKIIIENVVIIILGILGIWLLLLVFQRWRQVNKVPKP